MEEVIEVARYLVTKALAGRKEDIVALYRYIVEGWSPKDIEVSMGIRRSHVKSCAYVLSEKAGGQRRLRLILERLYPLVMGIEPVVSGGVCRLCRGRSARFADPEKHVKKRHRDVIERCLAELGVIGVGA